MNRISKKIKVAWFSSLDVNYLRKNSPLFIKNYTPNILAPWIDLSLNEFKKRDDVELHVIAAFYKLTRDCHFIEDGIHYHLITQKVPLFHKTYPVIFQKLTNYWILRKKVDSLLNKIKPDLIHMHGSDIDLSVCTINSKYPVLLTPSTFITHLVEFAQNNYDLHRLKREEKVLASVQNFGIRANFMREVIRKYNDKAHFYWHHYPINKPTISAKNFPVKDADIVFAARLNKNKGIEDLLYSLKKIMVDYQTNITLKIVGDEGIPSYKAHILNLIKDLELSDNVRFLGRMNSQEKLFEEIAKAKINVLPTHFEMIPGTILESMLIGTPVITYPVGGIPDLNLDEERVLFADKGNIDDLSSKILGLLSDKIKMEILTSRSLRYVTEYYDNEKAIDDMILAYKSILNGI
jgi:glycosyltransferase involved in cell wall biosynthesis